MKKNIIIVTASLLLSSVTFAEDVPVVSAGSQPVLSFNKPTPAQQFVLAEDEDTKQTSNKNEDQTAQITALQEEIQALRGVVEMQQHDISQLKKLQADVYKDLDNRLTQMGSSSEQKPLMAASAPAREETVSAPDADGRGAYNLAYSLVRAKQYAQAITAMESFVSAYPKSQYLANAHYWLGELYLSQTQYDKAILQFETIIKDFPDSNKVAGAHLKLGFAFYDKSKWAESRRELELVKSQYPDTTAWQVAKARLNDMDRQGL